MSEPDDGLGKCTPDKMHAQEGVVLPKGGFEAIVEAIREGRAQAREKFPADQKPHEVPPDDWPMSRGMRRKNV